jgi:hypothetical protein
MRHGATGLLMAAVLAATACGTLPTGPEVTQTFSGRATFSSTGAFQFHTDGGPIILTLTWTVVSPGRKPPPVVQIHLSYPGTEYADSSERRTSSPLTFTSNQFPYAHGALKGVVWVNPQDAADSGAVVDYVLTVTHHTR